MARGTHNFNHDRDDDEKKKSGESSSSSSYSSNKAATVINSPVSNGNGARGFTTNGVSPNNSYIPTSVWDRWHGVSADRSRYKDYDANGNWINAGIAPLLSGGSEVSQDELDKRAAERRQVNPDGSHGVIRPVGNGVGGIKGLGGVGNSANTSAQGFTSSPTRDRALGKYKGEAAITTPKKADAYSQDNWYVGDAPTTIESLSHLEAFGLTGRQDLIDGVFGDMYDPTKGSYYPYASATSLPVQNLMALGVTPPDGKWTTEFLQQLTDETFAQRYVTKSSSTGAPSMGKNTAQNIAKFAYDAMNDNGATVETEQEFDDYLNKIRWYADAGYSPDEIKMLVPYQQYSHLNSMTDKLKLREPSDFTRPILFSPDFIDGYIWAAQNGADMKDVWNNSVSANLGYGTVYRNPEREAMLDWTDKENFAPYMAGATNKDDLLYYGIHSVNQDWLDNHLWMMNLPENHPDRIHYENLDKAFKFTKTCNDVINGVGEDESDPNYHLGLYADIDRKIEMAGKNADFDRLFDSIMGEIDLDDFYKPIRDLDKSIENRDLKDTTDVINYSRQRLEKYVRDKIAEAVVARDKSGNDTDNTVGIVTGVKNAVGSIFGEFSRAFGSSQKDFEQRYNALPGQKFDTIDFSGNLAKATTPRSYADIKGHERLYSGTNGVRMDGVNPAEESQNQYDNPIGAMPQGLERPSLDELLGTQTAPTEVPQEEPTAEPTAEAQGATPQMPERPSIRDLPKREDVWDNGLSRLLKEDSEANKAIKDEQDRRAGSFGNLVEQYGTLAERRVWSLRGAIDKSETLRIADGVLHGNQNKEQAVTNTYGSADSYAAQNFYSAYTDKAAYESLSADIQNAEAQMQTLFPDGKPETQMVTAEDVAMMRERANINFDMKGVSRYDTIYQQMMDNGVSEMEMPVNPDDADKLEVYNRLNGNIDGMKSQLEGMQEGYDTAVKTLDDIDRRYRNAERLSELMGVPLEETVRATDMLTAASEYANSPAESVDFKAYDLYQNAEINYGYSHAEVVEGAKANFNTAQEHIDNIDLILSYAQDGRVNLPDEAINGLMAKREALVNNQKDAVYYLVSERDDFKDVVNNVRKEVNENHDNSIFKVVDLDNSLVEAIANPNSSEAMVLSQNVTGDTLDLMTDTEKNTFLYIYGTDGMEAAKAYYDYLTNQDTGRIVTRRMETYTEGYARLAEEHPVLATLGSVTLSPLANISGAMQAVHDMLPVFDGFQINEDGTGVSAKWRSRDIINPNAGGYILQQASGKAREVSRGQLVDSVGGSNTALGFILGNGYDIATSAADSAVNAMVSGGLGMGSIFPEGSRLFSVANGIAGSSLMGGGSAASTFRNLIADGRDPQEAMAMAGVTFIAETLTEAIEFTDIMEAFNLAKAGGDEAGKTFFEYLYKQAPEYMNEFFGEASSELVTGLADMAIFEEQSDFDTRVAELSQTMTEEQARRQAQAEFVGQIFGAGVAGALSAALSSSVGYGAGKATATVENAIDKLTESRQAKQLENAPAAEAVRSVVEEGGVKPNSEQKANYAPLTDEQISSLGYARDIPIAEQVSRSLGLFINDQGTNAAKAGAVANALHMMEEGQSQQIETLTEGKSQQEKTAISNAILMGGQSLQKLVELGVNPSAAQMHDFVRSINKDYKNSANRAKANAAVDAYMESATDPNVKQRGTEYFRDRFAGMSEEEYTQEVGALGRRVSVLDAAEENGHKMPGIKNVAAALATESDGVITGADTSAATAAATTLVEDIGVDGAAKTMRGMLITAAENGITGTEVISAVRQAVLAGGEAYNTLKSIGNASDFEAVYNFMVQATQEASIPEAQTKAEQAVYNQEVAEEVRNQVAQGSLDGVTPYQQAMDKAKHDLNEAQGQFEVAQRDVSAAQQTLAEMVQAFVEDPTNQQKGAAKKAALESLEGKIKVLSQMQQHLTKAENDFKAAEKSYNDVAGREMNKTRQAAIEVVDTQREEGRKRAKEMTEAKNSAAPQTESDEYTLVGRNSDVDKRKALYSANGVNTDEEGYPTSFITTQDYHTDEQKNVIHSYQEGINYDLLREANKYKDDKNAPFKRTPFLNVSERERTDIERLTGVDYSGYIHDADKNFFNHVNKRHGANGKADSSMSDINDIARASWIIQNYDTIELLKESDLDSEEKVVAKGYIDKNSENMQLIRYIKHLDGSVYLVEAVGENNYKKLHLISAYIQKNSANEMQSGTVTHTLDASSSPKHNALDGYTSPVENIVSQTGDSSQDSVIEEQKKEILRVAEENAENQIQIEKPDEGFSFGQLVKDVKSGKAAKDFEAKYLDDTAPLHQMTLAEMKARDKQIKELKKKQKNGETLTEAEQAFIKAGVRGYDATEDARKMVRHQRNAVGAFSEKIITRGLVDNQNNPILDSTGKPFEGYEQIFSSVNAEDEVAYCQYVLDKHALDRYNNGKKIFKNKKETKQTIEARIKNAEQTHPEFATTAKRQQEWFDAFMLNYRVKPGFITMDTYQKFRTKYPNYVPVFHVQDANSKNNAPSQRRITADKQEIITGNTDKSVQNPVMSMAGLIQDYIRDEKQLETMRALDAQFTDESVKELGLAVRLKDTVNTANFTDKNGVTKETEVGILDFSSDFQWSTTEEDMNGNPQTVIHVLAEDGKIHNWVVNDDGILDPILNNRNYDEIRGGVAGLLKGCKQILQFMSMMQTAQKPSFLGHNYFSDGGTARNSGNASGFILTYEMQRFKTLYDLVKEHRNMKKGKGISQEYDDFLAFGALHGPYVMSTPVSQRNIRKEMFKQNKKGIVSQAKEIHSVSDFVDMLKDSKVAFVPKTINYLGELTEEATRYNEFRNGHHDLTTYEGKIKAGEAAREATTDFSLRGSSNIIDTAGSVIPFVRPAIQGLNKSMNMFSDKSYGKRLDNAKRLGLGTLVSAAFMAVAKNLTWTDEEKDEYDNMLSPYEKMKYFHYKDPVSGTMIKFKRSQDPIVQFAAAFAEMLVDNMNGYEDNDFSQFVDMVEQIAFQSLPGTDTFFNPLIDAYNGVTYSGRNINQDYESMGITNKRDMWNEDTNAVFKFLSQHFPGVEMSADQWEYAAQQYFGSYGMIFSGLISESKDDDGLTFLDVMKVMSSETLDKFTSDMVMSTNLSNSFNNSYSVVKDVIGSSENLGHASSVLRSDLSPNELSEAVAWAKAQTSKGGYLYRIRKKNSALWKQYSEVSNDTRMTDEEREDRLRSIRISINQNYLEGNSFIANNFNKRWGKPSFKESVANGMLNFVNAVSGK